MFRILTTEILIVLLRGWSEVVSVSSCNTRITKFLEERSDLRFIFSGYYLDENGAAGGAQIPSKNFTGKGRVFAPIQVQQEGLQTKNNHVLDSNLNRRRFSTLASKQRPNISRSEGTTVIPKPELFGDTAWKVSIPSSLPFQTSW